MVAFLPYLENIAGWLLRERREYLMNSHGERDFRVRNFLYFIIDITVIRPTLLHQYVITYVSQMRT